MQLVASTLYLDVTDLMGWGVPENTVWSSCKRYRAGASPSWANIADPDDARRVLVDYDSVPAATVRKYGVPAKDELLRGLMRAREEKLVREAQTRQLTLPASVVVDTKELTWLLGQHIERGQAHGLARVAGWLKLLLTAKAKQCAAWGLASKEDLWSAALTEMLKEWEKKVLGGQRVNNVQVLKRKVKAYKTEGVAAVVSKRGGLQNAKKLTEMQENLLVQLMGDSHKPDYAVVHRLLLDASATYGWPVVSESTCYAYLNKPEVRALWYGPRHGQGAYRNAYDPIISRDAPSFANALWVMDGTPLELYFRDGKKAHNRFEMFVILDAHSWKVVGYALGRSENAEVVAQALRMACRQEGVVPHQVLSDNSSAIKSKEAQQLLGKLATHVTNAQVGNARTKIVEPFFKHLNARVLKYHDNYSGSNITARSLNSHINPDAARENIKSFPTENAALEQVHLAIQTWNADVRWKGKGQSPAQAYAVSMEASEGRQRSFSEAMEVEAFYYQPAGTFRYTNRGFDVTFRSERYAFDIEDVAFRAANVGARFQVKFDPERMDALYLYDEQGRLVVGAGNTPWVARPKTKMPMALVDRVAGDGATYARLAGMKEEQQQQHQAGFAARVESLPADLKAPITMERVHKHTLNEVRRAVKDLELSGAKTIPLPSIQTPKYDLYGDDEDTVPMRQIG